MALFGGIGERWTRSGLECSRRAWGCFGKWLRGLSEIAVTAFCSPRVVGGGEGSVWRRLVKPSRLCPIDPQRTTHPMA